MWSGFAVLLVGALLGADLHALDWNLGAVLVASSTVLFAIDFVIAKHLLRGLATLTVMTARMTIGTAILFVYVIAAGRLTPPGDLSATQWSFVGLTGVFLLLFTITTFTAIRRASVSAVLAIGTAAPIITTLIQVVSSGNTKLAPIDVAGLVLMLLAVVAIITIGLREDQRETTMVPAQA
jgi:drug/metabolite transporter (DMT)-like permease